MAARAHQKPRFFNRVVECLVGLGSSRKVKRALPHQGAKVYSISFQRNDDESVLRDAEDSSFYGFYSDDAIRQSFDRDLSADGVARRKQFRRYVRAHVGHVRGAVILGISKEATVGDIPIVDVGSV